MADSVKVVAHENRRLHHKVHAGHIHKGHSTVAANASIPTKFQTIITENGDNKGFLAKSRRFKEDAFMTEAPPPGSYGDIPKVDKISPSYSKRGTGSFASKSKRHFRYANTSGPGPGIYGLPSLLSTRKDFNRSQVERLFQLPIAQKREKTDGVPAPNSYEVLNYKKGKANNVTANAAFKSKSKRELMDLSEAIQNPAPGKCHISTPPNLFGLGDILRCNYQDK
ncbi:hypothetical protein EGW08_015998 [Elysia chlorotica]|uniref:Uncharacterized protein n=1 Tax=Elysia chlorotica TaxID=188477 RepID=A0A433T3T9_ELYCH|nr:hypothetical protein EGW08_015998 [Elysia chlorotica]